MNEVFGPGGFLEKCMLAGFDRTAVGSDYESGRRNWRWRIGARCVRNAPPRHRLGWDGHGDKRCLSAPGNLQRTARGDFHGDEVAVRNSSTRRISFSAEALRADLKVAVMKGAQIFCASRSFIRCRIRRC